VQFNVLKIHSGSHVNTQILLIEHKETCDKVLNEILYKMMTQKHL